MKVLYSYITLFLLMSLALGTPVCAYKPFSTEISPPSTGKLFENQQISISNPFPYPANENVTFTYQIFEANLDAKITLYDVVGNEVDNYRLPSSYSKVVIPTSSLRPGVYFYSLVLNNKVVITKKIVVSH